MIEIRRALQPILASLHQRVYYGRAPAEAEMPYLVYDLPNVRDEGAAQQVLTLEVDGWDRKSDTSELEALMAAVREGLDGQVLVESGVVFRLILDSQLSLADSDPEVRRRKLVFYGRVFRRSESDA